MQHKRASDVFGRLGGEEFGLLLPEVTQAEALVVGQRLLAHCNAITLSSKNGPIHLTFSGGVTQAIPTDLTVDHILQRADHALYHAKHSGRNRLELAEAGAPQV
jgi:diguanylate cyclase (GGDEF)-like protein